MIAKGKTIACLTAALFLAASVLTACGSTTSGSTGTKPVNLEIIDVAGTTQLVQAALNSFKAANPNLVSNIEVTRAPAPELAAKIKAEQAAGNVTTALVFTGYDGLAAGMQQGIWEQLIPKYDSDFPNLEENYLPGADQAFKVGQGYGVTLVYCPAGPMLTYNPARVSASEIDTPQKLLAWAKAHPGQFDYADPANSGPGREFLQGLPYLLGDKDPQDPKTWTKTWAYLEELNKYITYYPTVTSETFKELAQGSLSVIASHLGWDMNQRILGVVPPNFQGTFFENMTLVSDSQFACVPKGLSPEREKAALGLIQWLLKPVNQAVTYDDGYFYPGPAVKNVTLSMAPPSEQAKIKAFMRPAYDEAVAHFASVPQLGAQAMVEAFDTWGQLVGSKLKK